MSLMSTASFQCCVIGCLGFLWFAEWNEYQGAEVQSRQHTRSQLSFKQKEMFACWSWKSAADCRVSCFPEPSERRDGGWEAGVGATPNRRVPAGNHSRHRSWQPHHRTPQTEGKGEQTLRVTCFTGAVITALQTYLLACLPTPRPSPISQLRPDVCVQDSGWKDDIYFTSKHQRCINYTKQRLKRLAVASSPLRQPFYAFLFYFEEEWVRWKWFWIDRSALALLWWVYLMCSHLLCVNDLMSHLARGASGHLSGSNKALFTLRFTSGAQVLINQKPSGSVQQDKRAFFDIASVDSLFCCIRCWIAFSKAFNVTESLLLW